MRGIYCSGRLPGAQEGRCCAAVGRTEEKKHERPGPWAVNPWPCDQGRLIGTILSRCFVYTLLMLLSLPDEGRRILTAISLILLERRGRFRLS